MKIFTTILLFLLTQLATAQNWSQVKQVTQIPNPNLLNELDIYDIKYSSTGNIYILVSYIGNFKIDSVKFNGFPDSTSTLSDISLIKLNGNGNLLWVLPIGDSGDDLPESMELDENENIFLSGRFQYTCSFGSGNTLISTGGYDGFIAKINSSGAIQWAIKSVYGTKNDRTTAITLGTDGNRMYRLSQSSTFFVGDGTSQTEYTNASL